MEQQSSRTFLVRVWSQRLGEDQAEWRGRIECAATHQVHYFRDWETLVARLQAMLADPAPPDISLRLDGPS